jgi:simple sugar transport system ATP-binding protein
MTPVVEMRGIVKRFPGVVANAGVDFDLRQGEIHALLGENGAGKTTLMNVLYGLYEPDAGEILLRGRPVRFSSARDAINHGLGMVHQHFMLVPPFTVAENIVLGQRSPREPLVENPTQVHDRLCRLSDQYGLQVHPEAEV